MKISYKYCGVRVDVNLVEPDGWDVNPHEIVTKIAELARIVDCYQSGYISITVEGGAVGARGE